MKIRLSVNDELREVEVGPELTLMRFLREDLGLTGTKNGAVTPVAIICPPLGSFASSGCASSV